MPPVQTRGFSSVLWGLLLTCTEDYLEQHCFYRMDRLCLKPNVSYKPIFVLIVIISRSQEYVQFYRYMYSSKNVIYKNLNFKIKLISQKYTKYTKMIEKKKKRGSLPVGWGSRGLHWVITGAFMELYSPFPLCPLCWKIRAPWLSRGHLCDNGSLAS